MKPICITFAGAPGSSKTPTAYYLSWNLGFPIINNDAMRTEVLEDTLSDTLDIQLYQKRRDERISTALASKKSFIYDASVDRVWRDFQKRLSEAGYQWLLISFDLSESFLKCLYKAKGYSASNDLIRGWLDEHALFLRNFPHDAICTIDDASFRHRLELSLDAMRTNLS